MILTSPAHFQSLTCTNSLLIWCNKKCRLHVHVEHEIFWKRRKWFWRKSNRSGGSFVPGSYVTGKKEKCGAAKHWGRRKADLFSAPGFHLPASLCSVIREPRYKARVEEEEKVCNLYPMVEVVLSILYHGRLVSSVIRQPYPASVNNTMLNSV